MLTFISATCTREVSYNVKVMNPEKAKDFKLFTWHDVHENFKTPDDLKEKLRECLSMFQYQISMLVFFESRSTAASNKKWIISANDLDRMYAIFENNHEITFWCDKKVESITKRTSPDVNEDGPVTKRAKRQAAIDDLRKELAEKHAKKFSEPQYKLWALMITNGQWTDKDNPPNIPLFGCEKSKPAKKKDENTVEVFAGAAIQVIAPGREHTTALALAKSGDVTSISLSKKVSIRSQYLQQLHELQKLCDAGTITSAEFAEEKERVLTLRSLHYVDMTHVGVHVE